MEFKIRASLVVKIINEIKGVFDEELKVLTTFLEGIESGKEISKSEKEMFNMIEGKIGPIFREYEKRYQEH